MKKILSILMAGLLSLGVIACSPSQEKKSNSGNEAKSTNSQKEDKKYQVGEEVFIIDDNEKQVYSIKINGVKVANDFEYKEDFPEANRKQILEVDYTYKNIAKDDENKLQIHSGDLQLIDSTGAVAEHSSMFPKQKPQVISVGTNCTVQAYYGLANESNTIKIMFSSGAYKKNETIVFEVPVK